MNFADKLNQAIAKTTPICVGIDPKIDLIPNFLKEKALAELGDTPQAVAMAFTDFSLAIIDAVYDLIPAIKPQLAFFEMYGSAGILAFEKICYYAQKKGLLVIADAKRNDIGTTAEAYAEGFLGKPLLIKSRQSINTVDAITINPYLGSDGINPFIKIAQSENKGIFILVKTSNPSSGELQDLLVGDHLLHEELALLVNNWGVNFVGKSGFSSVGAVVGATYPEESSYLRSIMPQQIFLVPGYGAQGASAKDVKACFHKDGSGAIINSSRAIIFAYKNNSKYSEENFAATARDATLLMNKEIKKELNI